ncbi:MAG: hypothetical protein ACT4TC_03425 [Myxococcaceae bacterium]
MFSRPPVNPRWTPVSSSDGVIVTRRERVGSPLNELRATGMVDAPPPKVWVIV